MTVRHNADVALIYPANAAPLLLARGRHHDEKNARRALMLAYLALKCHGLGAPNYENGRAENAAAKVADAVMVPVWDGFVRAHTGILRLRQKLAQACCAPVWQDYLAAECAAATAVVPAIAAHVTKAEASKAVAAAAVKLQSLPMCPQLPKPAETKTLSACFQPDLFD